MCIPTPPQRIIINITSLLSYRFCQRKNIAYMATWHSNYVDYLQYYYVEWLLRVPFQRYLQGFYEQMPVVYVPVCRLSCIIW